MNTKKIVVLADIESVRVPFTSFEKALKEVSKYGDVAGCKFYGYSAKRTKDYADFIADNNYDALSSLAGKRKGKLDLRQVIDATRLAENRQIDGIFLLYGKGNIKPLKYRTLLPRKRLPLPRPQHVPRHAPQQRTTMTISSQNSQRFSVTDNYIR